MILHWSTQKPTNDRLGVIHIRVFIIGSLRLILIWSLRLIWFNIILHGRLCWVLLLIMTRRLSFICWPNKQCKQSFHDFSSMLKRILLSLRFKGLVIHTQLCLVDQIVATKNKNFDFFKFWALKFASVKTGGKSGPSAYHCYCEEQNVHSHHPHIQCT